MIQEKKIDEIKRLIKEAGFTVSEVFREAKVPLSTVQNWERNDPQPFKTEATLKATIEKMKTQKEAAV